MTLSKLFRRKEGSVAAIFALSLLPLMAVAGFAIDFSRINSAKVQLRAALDNAVLAAANLNTEDPDGLVEEWVISQMQVNGYDTSNITIAAEIASEPKFRAVSASATLDLPSVIMQLFGTPSTRILVEASAIQEQSEVEISLVLDISSSMRGSKLAALKPAASEFVDTMLEGLAANSTSINLVPYGGSVNIGDSLFNQFAVSASDDPTILDPSEEDYDLGRDLDENAFRFSDSETCLEVRAEDYNTDRISSHSRGQVPSFWQWWNVHSWCPQDESAVFLNSNSAEALKNRIDGMVLSDGTGMDIGAMWGLKFLSPSHRGDLGGDFAQRPLAFDAEGVSKFMVIMTDGNITKQNRPIDASIGNVHTNRNNRRPNQNSRRQNGNSANLQVSVERGNANARSSQDNAVGRFKRVCETAKGEGITVFTIGFQISRNSVADKILEECASSERTYFLVEDSELQSVFGAIASQIRQLRIAS